MPSPVDDSDCPDPNILRSVVEHVFMPPKLPQQGPSEQAEQELNVALCNCLIGAAHDFFSILSSSSSQSSLWMHMIIMMELARCAATVPFNESDLRGALSDLAIGDVFVMHVRAQNAAVIMRRPVLADSVLFEVFEVSPPNADVMKAEGKLLCSYPGPAVKVPLDVFTDESFLRELSSFLVQMDVDILDSTPTASKAGSVVHEVRESAHPRYISGLLVGILRGFGQPAVVDRITKRIGDEVLWRNAYKPWRRSPLWLVLRVTLRTSLPVELYKLFLLFFHARLLRNCLRRDFPSELLYVMRVKIARRLSKLGSAVSQHVCEYVHETAIETEALLSKRWTEFQAIGSTRTTLQPGTLDFVADTHISLNSSYHYLTKMSVSCRPQASFNPQGSRIYLVHNFFQFSKGKLAQAFANGGHTAIADFELSVERSLEPWATAYINNHGALDVIASCIQEYYAAAKGLYGTNAEDNSIMILTIMSLWVALDRLAIQQCPLLGQYSPEFPPEFLHILLLHRSSAINRALHIEEYLRQRHREALHLTSIFSNNVHDSCFAVKYFRTLEGLIRLYDEINAHAHEGRERKRAELVSLNQRSTQLLRQAEALDHKYSDAPVPKHKKKSYQKCKLTRQAKSLKIHVHEWPLPSSKVDAQQVVFELSPPHAFFVWRDITYKVLNDIGQPPASSSQSRDTLQIRLDTYSGLRLWARKDHRVSIGSTTKSFADQTHYKMVQIPAQESSVLVNNGLSFKLFDRTCGSWVIDSLSQSSVETLCTPSIPTSSPYSRLRFCISGTQHTPNDVIAAQDTCPQEISLHEYIAFSGLRSGPRLQWLNIARELASTSLSFRREEVHTLITQAAWQLGPLSDNVREWHVDLCITSFGNTLVRELESLLEKIKANWLEEVSVRTIVLICSRLLASTTDIASGISARVCALLRKARSVTFRWICAISNELECTQDEISCEGLRRRLCTLAATCFSTYDVCPEHVSALLFFDEDFSVAMQCAIIVHNNTPSSLSDSKFFYLERILSRHRRLQHDLEPIFSKSIFGPAGLLYSGAYNLALERLGLGYRNSSSWHALPRPNPQWISCVTDGGQRVHYNLLSGQLLIDGKELGRLPPEIVKHPTYANLLGTKIFDVAPADVLGMDYMTRSTVSGYQILFAWKDEDLVLQARRPGDADRIQLIPRHILADDFPASLIENYVHWLDLSRSELEFRPSESPWTPEMSNWRLLIHKPGIQPRAVLQRHSQGISESSVKLIDIRSNTFGVLSRLLAPLESPKHFIATYTAAKTVEVSLPRFRLSFFVNTNWELECRSMPGYVVDRTQTCGTMFGLTNKLILRPGPTSSEGSLLHRRLIIPQGNISFNKNGDFTSVSIDTGSEQHVPWHEYTIDTSLGCVTGNTSLHSKLYQCYLHALTSHCLPDPLLGHTGTEEALYILHSASCRSFQRLDVHEADLLELICDLTPDRNYYPLHLRSMATVKWNNLPALSQHHDFFRIVCSLFDHARALEALYDQPAVFETFKRNETLLTRAASRNKLYYPSDLQSSDQPSSPDDAIYRSRDIPDLGDAEHVAFQTSWSIWNSRLSVDHWSPSLWDLMNSWGSLGPSDGKASLRYSPYWLKFDASQDWFVIYDLCRKAVNGDSQDMKFKLCFSLPAAAYSKSKYKDAIPFIIVFALDKSCRDLSPPPDRSYILSDGIAPTRHRIEMLASQSALPIYSTPVCSSEGTKKQKKAEYNAAIRSNSTLFAKSILHWWPDHEFADFPKEWFSKSAFNQGIDEYTRSVARNFELRQHVLQLQSIIQQYDNDLIPTAVNSYSFSPQFIIGNSRTPSYSLQDVLVSRSNAPTPSANEEPFQGSGIPSITEPEPIARVACPDSLEVLIEELRNSRQPLIQLYGHELKKSHHALLGRAPLLARRAVPPHELLLAYYHECSRKKNKIFSEILAALAPSRDDEELNGIAGCWPRITPRSLLRQLAQDRITELPDQWRYVTLRYATSLLRYRHSIRLLELSSGQKREELLRELDAIHNDVPAESTPDWLLVQIEANLLARPVQVTVAREMISPRSKRNISLQLNMGEGKSSVIVPLVSTTLADGSNLVRVVTLKPLSNQMFQLLVTRLSGLANRPIFYLPFSRSLCISSSLVKTISGLYKRCVAEGGILVVQPEHILSQKLMHIDTLLTSNGNPEKHSIAQKLGTLQDWVTKTSRDVLDESDEILHVRYQLIYTSGKQMPVDDHPNRWTTIQQVFGRVQAHAKRLHARFPKEFEVDMTPRGFPIMRILDSVISREISSLIIGDALEGGLSNLPMCVLPLPIREAAQRFMGQGEISGEDRDLIFSHCDGTAMLKGILLLRGLLADGEGILGYVLKERRWRVDYGLDPSRTLLAVPYRAKDVPSQRAEFSHPDVAIALTCLSYYYGGLTKDQVLLSFGLLVKLDSPEMEYDHWVAGQDIPMELRRLNGVNTEDETQVDELLVPLFSRNKGAVDFYLSQVVFPRAAREFPSKLPTSAWDLVEDKKNLTTGFSGTNDNRYLLPTSITQEDPDFVLGTNALVLQHLLLPENDHYECTEGNNGERESATAFLQRLVSKDPEIRVLLDVGAQMLELRNEELARHWLSLRPDVAAAIFLNDSDHLTVVTPDGSLEPFISSPFNRQLDKCVVYLDEAHTRGTDLKLPQGMRAAVTLGPKVTKDRLVQGCMRMRQLGKGQTVMFFAPGEVDRRIRNLVPGGLASSNPIRVVDVLRWAMHETCEDICHHLPFWAQQGLDHRRRFAAFKDHSATGNLKVLRNAWVQRESRTLEEMYSLPAHSAGMGLEISSVASLSERMERLGISKLVDVRVAEEQEQEQEREVNHEIERERHVERPAKIQPAKHALHPDIRGFAETGRISRFFSNQISPLLVPVDMAKALDSTTVWSPSPLATVDFTTTVLGSDCSRLTDYLRPVNWVLSSWSGKDSVVIVISPFEANKLLPIIREKKKVRLHIYAPRVSYSMRSFSDLTFYSIPDSPTDTWSAPAHARIELNLFAGQLYFDSREEYESVCVLLALSRAHPGSKYSQVDGFVPPQYRTGRPSPFTESKVKILKTLIELRRKGMGYYRTHLGRILNASTLSEETLSVMSA